MLQSFGFWLVLHKCYSCELAGPNLSWQGIDLQQQKNKIIFQRSLCPFQGGLFPWMLDRTTWVLLLWKSWQCDRHQQQGWFSNLGKISMRKGVKDDLKKFWWPWFMKVKTKMATYGWHCLARRSGCNDFIHSGYLQIQFCQSLHNFFWGFLCFQCLFWVRNPTSRSLSKFMWSPSSIASRMSCACIECTSSLSF